MQNKWIAIVALVIIVLTTFWMVKKTPTGFIPTEDQGFIVYSANLPPGASMDRTQKVMNEIDSLLSQVEAIEKRGAVTGLNFIANASSSNLRRWLYTYETTGKRERVIKWKM
jgi:HAE1 family hydrophobic/amphiphilic exporter-1